MAHLLWRLASAAGVLTCGAVFATPAAEPPTRETPQGGVVARLPFVGTLTWRCDGERRFTTQLELPRLGASVTVGLVSDGTRVWRGRQVNPLPSPRRTVVGPFAADRRQTWTIRYHHKPATLKVVARLRFSAPRSRSQCVISRADIHMRRTAH
jgi:hypothetical protein